MEHDVLERIQEAIPSFSKGQKKIASYILENYDKTAFMTAGKLGTTVGVSESTVVRFAADIGFEGYPEMRKALQALIKNRLTSVQRIEVAKGLMNAAAIPSSVLTADMERIHATLETMPSSDFDAAADALCKAKSIYIMGMRSSNAIAIYMGHYLNMLFPNVRVVNESSSSEVFEQILRVDEGDVFIGISFPRYSRRTIRAMEYAGGRGAKVIAITDTDSSLLAQTADLRLYAKSDMISFVDSIAAPMSLASALIVAAANRSGENLTQDFARLEKIWSELGVYEKTAR